MVEELKNQARYIGSRNVLAENHCFLINAKPDSEPLKIECRYQLAGLERFWFGRVVRQRNGSYHIYAALRNGIENSGFTTFDLS